MQYELKSLSSSDLLLKTKTLAAEERRLTTEVLRCLREVEARLLYAELGYSSLYDFAIQELGYSEGSAHRRISAMRLLNTLSDDEQKKTEEKLNSGALTLTNVALLQSFFKNEKKISGKVYSNDHKIELLNQIEHRSKRESEKILAEIQPAILQTEKIRSLGHGKTEITFVADENLMQNLQKIRNKIAHRNSNASFVELFSEMAERWVKELNHEPFEVIQNAEIRLNPTSLARSAQKNNPPNAIAWPKSRFIPKSTRQSLWLRDQGRCTYENSLTKHKCNSQYGIEIDHIKPFSFGGTHELSNLRLRCRTHNRLHAKKSA